MTYDQVKNSYILKIVKRALMKQYPWIKDVEIDEEDFENYNYNIFLNVFIDPSILAEEHGYTIASWVGPGYDGGHGIGMFFKDRGDFSHINKEVGNLIDDVTDSPAIPEELRLSKPKNSFHVGSFISI
jgi:hypothetical protein